MTGFQQARFIQSLPEFLGNVEMWLVKYLISRNLHSPTDYFQLKNFCQILTNFPALGIFDLSAALLLVLSHMAQLDAMKCFASTRKNVFLYSERW